MHEFYTKHPIHLAYNRLPLLADTFFDFTAEVGLNAPQHTFQFKQPGPGVIVFVKTDLLTHPAVAEYMGSLRAPIILITGISDISPSSEQFQQIVNNPYIALWVGPNILHRHPKVVKVPIGMSEPGKLNSVHHELVRLHAERISWERKYDGFCVPYHTKTHPGKPEGSDLVPVVNPNHNFQYQSREETNMLPKMTFFDYMKTISSYKFVVSMSGFGVDTHRFCEILLMGSVPIVLRNTGLDDMYEQFPCVLVDSFDRIDVSTFIWDEVKYQRFLDMFWLKPAFYQRIFDESKSLSTM